MAKFRQSNRRRTNEKLKNFHTHRLLHTPNPTVLEKTTETKMTTSTKKTTANDKRKAPDSPNSRKEPRDVSDILMSSMGVARRGRPRTINTSSPPKKYNSFLDLILNRSIDCRALITMAESVPDQAEKRSHP